jgi:hypothetical protein
VVERFDKVNLIVRPGVQFFGWLEDEDETVTPTKTTKYTMLRLLGHAGGRVVRDAEPEASPLRMGLRGLHGRITVARP